MGWRNRRSWRRLPWLGGRRVKPTNLLFQHQSAGAAIVTELHELLKHAGVRPPYVLVGHSLGGLYTSLYAGTYPGEIAAVPP